LAFVVGCFGEDPVSSESVEPAGKLTVSGTKAGGSNRPGPAHRRRGAVDRGVGGGVESL